MVKIFNNLGQEVRRLTDRQYEAGDHIVYWDSKNNQGKAVASGMYFYELQAGTFSQVKKMNLVK
jgi:flagellar hook assembly protein FlgD